MFDENSVIYGYCHLEEKNFDIFLANFFDANGLCLVKGVSMLKEEAEQKIKEIKSKNELIRAKEIKKIITTNHEAAYREGLSKEEADELLRKRLSENEEKLYRLCSFESLVIPIKIDVLEIDNEQIKELIRNGKIETNDEIIGKRIYLDRQIYGLELITFLKKYGDPFISAAELNEKIKNDEAKRESIIEGILNYKKKFEDIDDGTFENESTPSQLSGGKHI